MNTWTEIDEEVERIKERLAAKFSYDVRAIGRDIQARERESAAQGWKFAEPAEHPRASAQPSTAQAS